MVAYPGRMGDRGFFGVCREYGASTIGVQQASAGLFLGLDYAFAGLPMGFPSVCDRPEVGLS